MLYMSGMKIRFVKSVLIEVEKTKLQEVWDKQYQRWDEVEAERIEYFGKKATIYAASGDTLFSVPNDSFEVVQK